MTPDCHRNSLAVACTGMSGCSVGAEGGSDWSCENPEVLVCEVVISFHACDSTVLEESLVTSNCCSGTTRIDDAEASVDVFEKTECVDCEVGILASVGSLCSPYGVIECACAALLHPAFGKWGGVGSAGSAECGAVADAAINLSVVIDAVVAYGGHVVDCRVSSCGGAVSHESKFIGDLESC